MCKMLIGQEHPLLRALPDSSLWPSVSFSTRRPRAIRHHNSSRGGENMMGNPSALSNASQTSGCWRGRQQSSRHTAITPRECHHHLDAKEHYVLDALCFEWHIPYLCHPLIMWTGLKCVKKIYTWATVLKNKQMGPGQQKCYVPKQSSSILYTLS